MGAVEKRSLKFFSLKPTIKGVKKNKAYFLFEIFLKGTYMRFIRKGNKGFSLVELMIVVSIIGILAALAVPRFQGFQARAKSAEARTSLAHVYTLQQSYYGDNDTYSNSMLAIGFSLNGVTGATIAANTTAKVRYTYNVSAATATTFTANASSAAGLLGSCHTAAHTANIDQNKTLNVPTLIPGC